MPSYTDAWLPGPDGTQFYTCTWAAPSPRAATLFLHGFADHAARYDAVHARWAARGVAVFAYDQRGFGRTALDAAHASAGAAYGRTGTRQEQADIAFWLRHVQARWPGLPVFLMGYSAGGASAITFVSTVPPAPEVAQLAGVLCAAPLITLVHPPAGLVRAAGSLASRLLPNITIPAVVPVERFTRDKAEVEAMRTDPWRRAEGSLRAVDDMLNRGIANLTTDWKNWPQNLPILIVHSEDDPVNAPDSSKVFYERLSGAVDKKLVMISGSLHDMYHESDGVPERVTEEYVSWIEAHLAK
ncbi:lysophospholipase [Phanerochaete sordida]|uniref:Lysophospholipase n=1 Tax=Phanerochaete sordida TaxID=48140 RepID=A0A9P3GSX5_9APHY|nr:lysophospholipase [Phanerochaete sordida]